MKKSKFTESKIIKILKQAEGGAKVADLAREHGVSALLCPTTFWTPRAWDGPGPSTLLTCRSR